MTNGWQTVELGKVMRLEIDAVPVDSQPEFQMAGVYSFARGLFKREALPNTQTTYKFFHRLHKDMFVISVPKGWEGALARVTENFEGLFLSPVFPTFRANPNELDIRYFEWYCRQSKVWDELRRKSRGIGARRESISAEKFLSLEIPLPPLEEQHRIIDRVQSLAVRITKAQSLRDTAIEDAGNLLIAMAHRSDKKRDELLKEGWEEVRLGEVIHQVKDRCRVEPNTDYPNLGIYSFARGLFHKQPIDSNLTSAKELYRVHKGQFIYSRLFAFEGACGIVTDEYDGCFVSGEYPTFDCDPSKVNPEFLFAYFKSLDVWRTVSAGSKGLGDRRQRVQPEKFLEYKLLLPPLEWQSKITSMMKKIDELQSIQSATGEELEALLPSVLDRAFKGEL